MFVRSLDRMFFIYSVVVGFLCCFMFLCVFFFFFFFFFCCFFLGRGLGGGELLLLYPNYIAIVLISSRKHKLSYFTEGILISTHKIYSG